jgi:prophage regulatory protein
MAARPPCAGLKPCKEQNMNTTDIKAPEHLLSRAEVMARTGLSRQTIYNWLAIPGRFPQPRKLGSTRLGWLESEVQGWINSRPLAEYPAKKWLAMAGAEGNVGAGA